MLVEGVEGAGGEGRGGEGRRVWRSERGGKRHGLGVRPVGGTGVNVCMPQNGWNDRNNGSVPGG